MSTMQNELLPLLSKIKTVLAEVKSLTEGTAFSGHPNAVIDDTERFAELYDQRDALLAELGDVRKALSGKEIEAVAASSDAETQALIGEIKTLLTKILELDNKNKVAGEGMRTNIKNGIKRIKQGRNISLKYSENSGTDGFKLDNKN